MGAQQQAQAQAELDAARIGSQTAAFEPIERLSRLGTGVASLISGYPAREQMQTTPSPSALSTGLGTASTLAGIYRMLNPQPTNISFNTGNPVGNVNPATYTMGGAWQGTQPKSPLEF